MPISIQPYPPQFAVAAAPVGAAQDPILRLQEDLQRALKKNVDQRRWVMVLDLRKCVGCSSCTIACVSENKLPPGVVYRPVIEEEYGTYPNVTRRFLPRPCMQCDNPPCVEVCPVGATQRRSDGIITIDYQACIGCRYCLTACPYAARSFDSGRQYLDGTAAKIAATTGRQAVAVYEQTPSYEYGQAWPRAANESPIGNARKCQFCAHRLDAGMLPACVTTCIGRATFFGDANDPDALVAELVASPHVMRLKEELGTEPRVYYLI